MFKLCNNRKICEKIYCKMESENIPAMTFEKMLLKSKQTLILCVIVNLAYRLIMQISGSIPALYDD